MARYIKIAAAQMGPNNEDMRRDQIIERMLALMDQAIAERVEILAYPEMALTTYFPKRIRNDYDQFFVKEIPPKALTQLLAKARAAGVICHVGLCEMDGDRHFNTAILADETGKVCGRFRKIHLPGLDHADPHGVARVFEPYYFETGDTGFQVFPTSRARIGIAICQDRRYSETYRCLGLLGAEIVLIGYNTPAAPLSLEHNELVMRAGAYENHLFVVAIAKAGIEDGVELIGGSCIISPLGVVLAKAATTTDELVTARIDLDQITLARQRWNFFGRRHPEHYSLITEPVKEEWKDARLVNRVR
jgi:N-carbamoyl-D-amino-acid hydrolase